MARVFTDGGEMGDALFFELGQVFITATTNDPTPAYSAYCYSIEGGYCYACKLISALSEAYLRERIWLSNAANTTICIPAFRNGSTIILTISTDATGHVVAKRPDATLATSTLTLNDEQWYLLEVYVKIADSGGRVVVYVDGVLAIDYTGDTKYSTYTNFDNLFWRPHLYLGTSGQLGLDDLALNDTTGGSDDSWCGDGIIIKTIPAGNGTDNDWTGSDADQVNNFEMVDEFPKDDDTTFVYADGADSGIQDQYSLSDYDGTGKIITRVYPEARVRKTAASTHTVKLGIKPSGAADQVSAAKNLLTSYTRIVGDEYTDNPADSNPWEEADIDALELIVEVG